MLKICSTSQIIIKIFFIIIFSIEIGAASEKKEIIVVFRYDDYSATSALDLEARLIQTFKKHNISITFGVVPYMTEKNVHSTSVQKLVPLTKEKIDLLKGNTVDVAQHGYSHQTVGGKNFSEFSGVDYGTQFKKIQSGKLYLEKTTGTKINTFIPPWNSYDINTLKALESLNFNLVSNELRSPAIEGFSLKYLPATCSISAFKDAVKSAESIPDLQPVIIILFHQYDFREFNRQKKGIEYEDFEELVDWTISQKYVRVLSVKQAAETIKDLGVNRLKNSTSYLKPFSLLPAFIRSFLSGFIGSFNTQKIYLSSSTASLIKTKGWIIVILFQLGILILSSCTCLLIKSKLNHKRKSLLLVFKYGLSALLFILLVYTLFLNSFNLKLLMSIDIISGTWAVLLFYSSNKT